MNKYTNAYDVVNMWISQGKYWVSENEINDYQDSAIIRAVLTTKYNGKYNSSDEPRFCGTYTFDNPTLTKQDYYALSCCYFHRDKWESVCRYPVSDKYAYRMIYRIEDIDWDKNKEEETCKTIFDKIMRDKIFVGKRCYWKIDIAQDY